jgi:hypothetical protein
MADTRAYATCPSLVAQSPSGRSWLPRLVGLLVLAGGWWVSSFNFGTFTATVVWSVVTVVVTPLLAPQAGQGGDDGGWWDDAADADSGGGGDD